MPVCLSDITAIINESSVIEFPYNCNPSQAANGGTNAEIPGKYIFDLNCKQAD